MITFNEFQKVYLRVGKIVEVETLPNTKYTTHKLTIDFEELGRKISCARVVNYNDQELIGRLVIGIVNFPPRKIGKTMSEVLTLGVPDAQGECILLQPSKDVPLGGEAY
jgi:tRNA-binding protein